MLVSMSGCRGERHRRAHRSMRRPATGLPWFRRRPTGQARSYDRCVAERREPARARRPVRASRDPRV